MVAADSAVARADLVADLVDSVAAAVAAVEPREAGREQPLWHKKNCYNNS